MTLWNFSQHVGWETLVFIYKTITLSNAIFRNKFLNWPLFSLKSFFQSHKLTWLFKLSANCRRNIIVIWQECKRLTFNQELIGLKRIPTRRKFLAVAIMTFQSIAFWKQSTSIYKFKMLLHHSPSKIITQISTDKTTPNIFLMMNELLQFQLPIKYWIDFVLFKWNKSFERQEIVVKTNKNI